MEKENNNKPELGIERQKVDAQTIEEQKITSHDDMNHKDHYEEVYFGPELKLSREFVSNDY